MRVLDLLEAAYGPQRVTWPVDPYEFLVWWHCGYPASDAAGARGWESLRALTSIEPAALLATSIPQLAAALAPGGMVPEKRAMRLKEIAARVQKELGGDLRASLAGTVNDARKVLKRFPNIADPGAHRILLFAGIAPVAAVPSNVPYVLVRIRKGRERENYGVTYREAQLAIETEVETSVPERQRAYLLLKRHGQETCKRSNPRCSECPVSAECAYFDGASRGRMARA